MTKMKITTEAAMTTTSTAKIITINYNNTNNYDIVSNKR